MFLLLLPRWGRDCLRLHSNQQMDKRTVGEWAVVAFVNRIMLFGILNANITARHQYVDAPLCVFLISDTIVILYWSVWRVVLKHFKHKPEKKMCVWKGCLPVFLCIAFYKPVVKLICSQTEDLHQKHVSVILSSSTLEKRSNTDGLTKTTQQPVTSHDHGVVRHWANEMFGEKAAFNL